MTSPIAENHMDLQANLRFQLSLVRLTAPNGFAGDEIEALERLLASPKGTELAPRPV